MTPRLGWILVAWRQGMTDVDSRLIVATRATNSGGDMGQVEPTLDEIRRRLGGTPEKYLVDGGYAKRESVDRATDQG